MKTHCIDEAYEEKLKSWIWRYYNDCWNRGDFSIVDEIAGDFQACSNNLWAIQGPEGIKESMGRLRFAFPDMKGEIEEYYIKVNVPSELGVACDKVTIWWNIRGSFLGEIEGISPTGKPVKIAGVSMLFIDNFKLIAARAVSDIYQVLGSLPQHNQS